jgi:hypothetical protein
LRKFLLGPNKKIIIYQKVPKNPKDLQIEIIGGNTVMEALEYAFA